MKRHLGLNVALLTFLALFSLTDTMGLNIEKALELDIDQTPSGIRVNLCIGSPLQCFKVAINLNRFFTWVADTSNPQENLTKFSLRDSTTSIIQISEARITFENNKVVYGAHFTDSVQFSFNQTAQHINLFTAFNSQDFPSYEGIISLGCFPSRTERGFALLRQLFNKQAISHKVFSIFMTDKAKGKLVMGALPYQFSNIERMKTCTRHVIDPEREISARNWECTLKAVKINYSESFVKDSFDVNASVGFDYNVDFVLVPINYLTYLNKSVFKPSIESNVCRFEVRGEFSLIACRDKEGVNQFKDILLSFEGWEVVIPREKLFQYDAKAKEYLFILACREKEKEQRYVIGNRVLKLFVMVFNEEEERIGFLSNDEYLITLKDNEEGGNQELIPPFHPNRTDMGSEDKVIPPPPQKSFSAKFMIVFGSIVLFVVCLFAIWIAFRYVRRRKPVKPLDYAKIRDVFN